MTPAEIVRLRTRFLSATATDAQAQADFRELFVKDFTMWLRLTGWTYAPREVGADGREAPSARPTRPLVLWSCQEAAATEILEAIAGGRDVVVRKSRDMGASWLISAVAAWGWLFHGWQTLLVSRVEDGVDRAGDPDSLCWKIDFLLEAQPPWLLPMPAADLLRRGSDTRQHMMLRHPVTGATITGQASTAHVGRGGRRTVVLFDEFAAMDDAEAAWRSAADCTATRIAVSTPLGAGTHYASLVRQAGATGDPRMVTLLYTDHPQKGHGAESRIDADGRITGTSGSTFVWTPWLQEQLARRDTVDMAQNVFATEVGSGANFFSPSVVTQALEGTDIPRRCEVVRGKFVDDANGRWQVWRDGEDSTEYAMFADPAYGTGSANAAICVMDMMTHEVVAEWQCPNTPPHDLAIVMVDVARTRFAGRRPPIIGWEVNGAGAAMHHDFERLNWSEVYRQREVGTASEGRTSRVGWHSTRRTKRVLLSGLSRALSQGEVTVRSEATLREMLDYVIMSDGSIEAASVRDLSSGARESHGDRVIALAGVLMLCEEGLGTEPPPLPPAQQSIGSLLGHAAAMRNR